MDQETVGKSIFVVRARDDLEGLLQRRRGLLSRPSRVHVSIEFPDLDLNERSHYERTLSRACSDCGCSWGAAVGLMSVVGYVSAIVAGVGRQLGWALLPIGLLLFVTSVGVGKAIGLARARVRIRRTIQDLLAKESAVSVGI